MKDLALKGIIELLFCDESGFYANMPTGYAWVKKGEEKLIPQNIMPECKMNVLGLYNYAKESLSYSYTTSNIDSEMFINLFEIAKSHSDKPVFVVIDNYSVHKSKITAQKMQEWNKEGIFFYFLPPYSPELNKIENIWRHVKYNKIKQRSFKTKEDLITAVCDALNKI